MDKKVDFQLYCELLTENEKWFFSFFRTFDRVKRQNESHFWHEPILAPIRKYRK